MWPYDLYGAHTAKDLGGRGGLVEQIIEDEEGEKKVRTQLQEYALQNVRTWQGEL